MNKKLNRGLAIIIPDKKVNTFINKINNVYNNYLKDMNSILNVTIPWYIMTSTENSQATIEFFKSEGDYKNKHKMIMLIPALSSGCVSLFRIIFNNGIGFLIENLFQDLPGQWASSKRCML